MSSIYAVLCRAGYALGLLLTAMPVTATTLVTDQSLVETGRRIYEEGILPSGKPLRALRPEGFTMEGKHAACVTCHRRSGMGSVEGNVDTTVLVTPVAGPVLFAAARFSTVPLDPSHHYIPNDAWERAVTRSAYDASSFAMALREGKDPDGKLLVSPMPRYELDDTAVSALSAYLAQLTSRPEPGVEKNSLHIATVVTPDAQPEQAEAVLSVLREWSGYARGSGVPWQLHEWHLSGPVETWNTQLMTYYRQRPVFALLSGVGGADWTPVHRFCEQHHIPCVLPSVEVVPDTGDDWYSLYYSSGIDLEAGILSRYLTNEDAVLAKHADIIQLFADASGKVAARLLRERVSGKAGSVSNRYMHATSPRAALKGISDDDILIMWLRPDEIMQLATEMPEGPGANTVYLSALLASPEDISLPASWKTKVRYVSLFDDLSLQGEIARQRLELWLESAGLAEQRQRRLQADAYVASYLFNKVLGMIRKQELRRPAVHLNREHLLETLETLVYKYSDSTELVDTESHVAWYGRMSLGPRQRLAVRGGTIMHYVSPGSNKLTALSRRIVP